MAPTASLSRRRYSDGTWPTSEIGQATQQIKAAQPGQYRLSYTVTDDKKHTIEGGYVFVVRGEGFDGHEFRFNDIELVADKKEYQPGEKIKLMINTARADSTVVLFLRPTNGVYLAPKIIHLKGKSTVEEIAVAKKDMPNFYIEAFTIGDARLFDDMREIVVPPESRVINVAVTAFQSEISARPEGESSRFKLTDPNGQPVERLHRGQHLRQGCGIHLRRIQRSGDQELLLEVAAEQLRRRPSRSLFRASGQVLHSGEIAACSTWEASGTWSRTLTKTRTATPSRWEMMKEVASPLLCATAGARVQSATAGRGVRPRRRSGRALKWTPPPRPCR